MNIREPDIDREPPHDDLLAGEYVLGVLDAAQRRQVQSRIEGEPEFARRVSEWEARLAALCDEIVPVDVPAHVWLRLRNRLGWAPVEGARRGLWQNVSFWRGATAAALATAAVVAVVALMRPLAPVPGPAPTPVVVVPPLPTVAPQAAPAPVTTLADEAGEPVYLASIDARHGRVRLMPVPDAIDGEGRVPELWLIPPGQAPRSLGVVDTATAREIEVPADLRAALAAGSTLAISLEPPGGAPQGVPTGPIVATGGIQAI